MGTLAPFRNAGRAMIPLTAHFILLIFLMTLVWLLEKYMRWLWGEVEPLFFGTIPWKWAFDTVDLALVVVFSLLAVRDCYLELAGGEK
jgi:hypothetical protein